MKQRMLLLLLSFALALSLCACAAQTVEQRTQGTAASEAEPGSSDSTETTVTFTTGAASIMGSGCKADGAAVTISESGTYRLTGSCEDGSVTVKKRTTGVRLILDSLTLTSADSACIVCGKGSEVTIEAASGTHSTLCDTERNNNDTYPSNDNAENAVIKCKDGSQVTFCGTGTLTITANGKNGVKSGASTTEDGEASLTIRELTLLIDAPVNDAINAGQTVSIESGSLTISAGDDAIHCDYVMQIGADGTDGPSISITDCYEGLEAAELLIASGDLVIRASDDCLNAANSDLIGFAFSISISGGTIDAYTTAGDGFDSNGSLAISGGEIRVWTANTADNQPLDADGTITITGGTVLAAGGSAGMGMNLSTAQPYVRFGQTGGMRQPGTDSDALVNAGETLAIADGSDMFFSAEAPCDVQFVFFCAPTVTTGSPYTLLANGESTGGAEAQTEDSKSGPGGMPDARSGFGPNGAEPPERPAGQAPSEPPDASSIPDRSDGQTPPEKPDTAPEPPDGEPDGSL